jgi:hypothetical protein
MKRREFLNTAALVSAIGVAPLATRIARAADPAVSNQFIVARSIASTRGAQFEAIRDAACTNCDVEMVRIRIDGLHVATHTPVLQSMTLSAMFDRPGMSPLPFIAWHFEHGPKPRMSQRMSFVAARDRIRGLELEYRLNDDAQCRRETCALTAFTAPLLSPGHYALLGPRRDGTRVDASTLRHSGNIEAPLAAHGVARDFDYLAFRVEAIG